MQVAIKSGISRTVAAFLAFGQVAAADDWAQDPANVSEAYPPAVHELTFTSDGQRLPAIGYTADGEGPHPTVVLLHGYPGNEKNLDLAQAIRRAGWNVIFFHYRGAWGAEGEFSFQNAEQDVLAVLDALRGDAGHDLRIDTEAISVVGHSMGGHMALSALTGDPQLLCGVSLDGVNLGAYASRFDSEAEYAEGYRSYSDGLFMLNGWSGNKAATALIEDAEHLDLIPRLAKVNGRPLLFVMADSDVVPLQRHLEPLTNELSTLGKGGWSTTIIRDDHSFSVSRLTLAKTVIEFLQASC